MPKSSDTGHAALRSFLQATQGDVVLVIGGMMVPGRPSKDLDDGDLVHFETQDGVSLTIRIDRIDGWGSKDAKDAKHPLQNVEGLRRAKEIIEEQARGARRRRR